MVARQRAAIGDGDIVVEGRDIGTTVAPEASVKVFLIADPSARAARRAAQDGVGEQAVASTEADLARRDAADSTRAASPLTQATDAVVFDSTHLDAAATIAQVVALATAASPS